MVRHLYHYLHKLMHMGLSRYLRLRYAFKNEPGAYYGNLSRSFSFSRNVVIDVWDSDLFHLGDQLFFLELVQVLKDEGIAVWISGTTGLAPLWSQFGVRLCDDFDEYRALSGAIILTKFDMLWQVSKRCSKDSYCIGYKFDSLTGNNKITNLLYTHVVGIINDVIGVAFPSKRHHVVAPTRFFKELDCPCILSNITEAMSQFSYSKWALVNDEVASNVWSAKNRLKLVKDEVLSLKEEGYGLIYVGINSEKSTLSSYVDIDLRGQTSVMELCALLKEEFISVVISFDTFLAHIAYCFQKNVIVIKKSISYSNSKIYRYIPLFEESKMWVKKIL